MDLLLQRNEKNCYELCLGEIVLVESAHLSDIMERAQTYAKKFRKKLFVSAGAISDWYVGFPADREQAPEVFFDPYFIVKATLENMEHSYRFVEGPFLTEEQAVESAFKIAGKAAKVLG